jgi:hypothetical protein
MAHEPFTMIPDSAMALPPLEFKVYAVLTRHADAEGVCWPKVARLAGMAGCSVRSVQRALRALVRRGALAVEVRLRGNGSQRSNLYRLRRRGDSVSPLELEDRLLAVDQVVSEAGRAGARAREGVEVGELEPLPGLGVESVPKVKVDGKRVSAVELALAGQVLDVFNELTGRRVSLASRPNLVRIVERIREWPQFGAAEYRRVIERQLAAPWWPGGGPPELRMIFSPDAFGIAVDQAREWDGGPVERPWRRGGEAQSLDDLVAMADRLEAREAAREGE